MKNQTMIMNGIATLNLMSTTNNAERFMNLLQKDMIIDGKVNFLTCEGEVITVNIFQFLDIQWKAEYPEFEDEKAEVVL